MDRALPSCLRFRLQRLASPLIAKPASVMHLCVTDGEQEISMQLWREHIWRTSWELSRTNDLVRFCIGKLMATRRLLVTFIFFLDCFCQLGWLGALILDSNRSLRKPSPSPLTRLAAVGTASLALFNSFVFSKEQMTSFFFYMSSSHKPPAGPNDNPKGDGCPSEINLQELLVIGLKTSISLIRS